MALLAAVVLLFRALWPFLINSQAREATVTRTAAPRGMPTSRPIFAPVDSAGGGALEVVAGAAIVTTA